VNKPSWRDDARRVIDKTVALAIYYHGEPSTWDETAKRKAKQLISNAYPFGMKKYRPYQVWLEERKETLIQLGIEQRRVEARIKARKEPKPKRDEVAPGQLSLF
jgi:hypothetical protein